MSFVVTIERVDSLSDAVVDGLTDLLMDAVDSNAGTVQLQPAWAPNQPHRGDVAK